MKALFTSLFTAIVIIANGLTAAQPEAIATKQPSASPGSGSATPVVMRGEIRDRNGKVVVASVPSVSVYADRTLCAGRVPQVAGALAALMNTNAQSLASRLQGAEKDKTATNKWVLLIRNMPLAEWAAMQSKLSRENFGYNPANLSAADTTKLNQMREKLFSAREGQTRVYPYNESLAHVLGTVVAQNDSAALKGNSGVELTFDEFLSKNCGAKSLAKGHSAVLTVDMRIQKEAEKQLGEVVQKHSPRGASVLVIRPQTGEILAWADTPTFHPARMGASPKETWLNRPLAEIAEPGSVFGVINLATALNVGLITMDTQYDCEQGRFLYAGRILRDHEGYAVLSVREILAKSSNIGMAKIAIQMGPERFYAGITNFGFGRRTGIALPSEVAGIVSSPDKWYKNTIVQMAFGQGLACSQLQMAMAMSAIANNGKLMRPMIVRSMEAGQGQAVAVYQPETVRQVIRPEIARQVAEVLKSVVSTNGTAQKAALENYSVAGKTGTAQKAGPKGYEIGKYYASFVGFVPADNPQLCISVVVDEPDVKTGYYGGQVAAPVFREVARQAVAVLSIPPDKTAK